MLNDKEYIDWLKKTIKIIKKYNLKHILFEVKTMHPLGDKGIVDKDMLKVNIKDNKETIENHIFDVL